MLRRSLGTRLAGLLAGLLVATSIPSMTYTARAAARPHDAPPAVGRAASYCHTLRVQLNGDQPATSTCLDPQPQANGQVQPQTAQTSCASSDLHLWSDANYSGDLICFSGTGSVNLTDYGRGYFGNWNDAASSYSTGQRCGTFYADINLAGVAQGFGPGQSGGFTNGTPVHNDQLSSLAITC